jgi:hypothetical protein
VSREKQYINFPKEHLANLLCDREDIYESDIKQLESTLTDERTAKAVLKQKLEIAIKCLSEIRNNGWGTDHCDGNNMAADEALAKIEEQ